MIFPFVLTGGSFGLLGPNGAGKTTTLRMLATLIKPDKGDALIDGSSIVTDPSGVRKKIGFLTSELKLEEFLHRITCLTFSPNYTVLIRQSGMRENGYCFRSLVWMSLQR